MFYGRKANALRYNIIYTFTDVSCHLISNYLSKQCALFYDAKSNFIYSSIGVPQGSI